MPRLLLLLGLLWALPWSGAAAQSGLPSGDEFLANVFAPNGDVIPQHAILCRPKGPGPATLVVIAHGTPASAAARPMMQLSRCGSEAAQWFVRRGYAVAFFLRPGYGGTGGPWLEGTGKCETAEFVRAGLETAKAIDAVVNTATALPGIKPRGAIVIGQSAGGWGAVAYDSIPHPKVVAIVSMAGGRGGRVDNKPNRNCRPDHLADAAAQFGRTASTPMLWVFAANDSFFAPAVATGEYQAFSGAGGKAEFEQMGEFGEDGHRLFFGKGGSAVWGPLMERYLAAVSPPG